MKKATGKQKVVESLGSGVALWLAGTWWSTKLIYVGEPYIYMKTCVQVYARTVVE